MEEIFPIFLYTKGNLKTMKLGEMFDILFDSSNITEFIIDGEVYDFPMIFTPEQKEDIFNRELNSWSVRTRVENDNKLQRPELRIVTSVIITTYKYC